MIHIYSSFDLDNRITQEQAAEEWHKDNISNDSYRKILAAHPSGLYTPNYFIRIALALFTIIAVLFSGGLMAFIFSANGSYDVLLLLFAILCYLTSEILVSKRKYFNAGIDNVLLTGTLILVQGFIFTHTQSFLFISFVSLIICLWLSLRFVDAFMAGLAYLFLCLCVFLLFIKFGDFAKATAPFVIMLLSTLVYFAVNKLEKANIFPFYRHCMQTVSLLTLLSFYAAGNYYFVRELSNNMFNLNMRSNESIPLGWLFWILTFAIPIFYIIAGLLKKSLMLLRSGLLLVALSFLTFRYYYHILQTEWVLLIAGVSLAVFSYLLIKYLQIARYGFTSRANNYKHNKMLGLESLIIAQVFGKKPHTPASTQSGGGSFGGAGAGENY